MKWPGKDNIALSPEPRTFELPPEGRYTVELTGTATRRVSTGTWMTFKEKIVGGEHDGFEIEEDFWISDDGQKMDYTYSRLGNICEHTGFWPEIDPEENIEPEAFALLWTPGLRWEADMVHDLQIIAYVNVNSYKDYTKTSTVETEECPFRKYIKVGQEAHDEWRKEGGQTWDSLVPAAAASFLSGVDLLASYGPAADAPEAAEPMAELEPDLDLPF